MVSKRTGIILPLLMAAIFVSACSAASIQSSPTSVIEAFLDRMCSYDYDGANALIAPDHSQHEERLANFADGIRQRGFCSIDETVARQQTGLFSNPNIYNVTVMTTGGERAVFYAEQLEGKWYVTSSWDYFADW